MSYEWRQNEIMAIALRHLSQHYFVPTDPKQWKTSRLLALRVVQSQDVNFPTLANRVKANFQHGSYLVNSLFF